MVAGDAVGGIYPDDDTNTYKLGFDGIGAVKYVKGNVSYVHFGYSDFVGTVSKTAAVNDYMGSDLGDVNNNNTIKAKPKNKALYLAAIVTPKIKAAINKYFLLFLR